MNPMLAALNQNRMAQNLQPIKNMMSMLRSAGNPQMMLQQMTAQNPQFKQAVDYVNANGGDAKTACYKLAKEKGINPDEILQMLRGM